MNIYDAYFTEMERKTTYVHLDEFDPQHLWDVLNHFVEFEITQDTDNHVAIGFENGLTIWVDKNSSEVRTNLANVDITTLEMMTFCWVNKRGKETFVILLNNANPHYARALKQAVRGKKYKKVIAFETKKLPPRQKRVQVYW